VSELPCEVSELIMVRDRRSDGATKRRKEGGSVAVHRCVAASFVAAALAAGPGCAVSRVPQAPRAAAWIPGDKAVPRVTVYGSLGRLLPAYDETPALERFLYGPAPGRSGAAALRNPQGMTFTQGRILVCDQGFPDILAIDPATGRIASFGDSAHPPRCPVDITADVEGRTYVADTTLRAVLLYGADQRFLAELRPPGLAPESFRPCSVLVHGGILYVGNLAGRRLDRFDVARETWLPPFAPSGTALPLIAPTGLAAGPAGELLVVDALQGVVQRVTAEGRWLIPIGRPGRGAGQFVRPKQIRCTASRLIFVSDAGRQSVLVFDATGSFLFEIGGDAVEGGRFSLPVGLVTLRTSDLPVLAGRLAEHPELASEECVIVSDSLGGESLVVIGVVARAAEDGTDAH